MNMNLTRAGKIKKIKTAISKLKAVTIIKIKVRNLNLNYWMGKIIRNENRVFKNLAIFSRIAITVYTSFQKTSDLRLTII